MSAAKPAIVRARTLMVAAAIVATTGLALSLAVRGCLPARPTTAPLSSGTVAPRATSVTTTIPSTTTSARALDTSVAATTTLPVALTASPTDAPITAPVATRGTRGGPDTTGPTTASSTVAPATVATGAPTTAPVPCTPEVLRNALARGGVDVGSATLSPPRCTADFASTVLKAARTQDRFAVFELREPEWALVNIGTSFVCQPLEIPDPDYTSIGCPAWDH